MTKKSSNNPDKAAQHHHHHHHHHSGLLSVQPVGLIIGPWKKLFTDEQCKIIIAEALNFCIYNEGMCVAGYLITERRVCLVLEIERSALKNTLLLFYGIVKQEIERFRNLRKHHHWHADESDDWFSGGKYKELFRQYTLVDDELVKLITGRPFNLPYYSPHLARLKARIHNYNFCSAVDYSGAIGPVSVKLLHWHDHTHLIGDE